MKFSLLVALSHLKSRRNETGISVITLVSMVGVMVGVTALIMVLAVMEGFEIDLRDKILGSNAHLMVLQGTRNFPWRGYEGVVDVVEETEGIVAAAPFIYREVMIRSEEGVSGVILKGIDPEKAPEVTDVASNITYGTDGELSLMSDQLAVVEELPSKLKINEGEKNGGKEFSGILIGDELATLLGVKVGDPVYIINPISNTIGPGGVPMPQAKTFRVDGVFYSGMYEYDNKWTYVALEDAQQFLSMQGLISGIEGRVEDIDTVEKVTKRLQDNLPAGYIVNNWKSVNQNLLQALETEKIVMGLILSLIIMVACLNIIGTLILVVLTRNREIAILRAMGASSAQICGIFMFEGLIIGLVGTFLGTILGLIGCWALKMYKIPLDINVYYLDTVPVVVESGTVLLVAVVAILISFLATIYPAIVASRLEPVDGLRYD